MEKNNNTNFEPNPLTHFPIHRCELIKKGIEELEANNEKKGIYYLSKSCFSQFHYEENVRSISKDITLDKVVSMAPQKENGTDALMNFISNELIDVKNETESVIVESDSSEDANIEQFYKRCSRLPNEWNTVQLTRLDDTYDASATLEDLYSVDSPITITLFKHALSSKTKNELIAINFGFFNIEAEKIYRASYKLYMEEFKNYKIHEISGQHVYNENVSALLSELMANLAKWLGPWIVLFSGNVKGENGKKFEEEIYSKVDELSTKIGSTKRQKILLSLLARRCDLLNSDTIKVIAEQFSNSSTNYLELVKFFSQLRINLSFNNMKYYPSLIILDQYLDFFPWEMLIPKQEMTRFNSIYMLLEMYETFKDQISDGYLKTDLENGISLINPDKDKQLNDMSKRMDSYYSTSFPDWKIIKDQLPTKDEMVDIFETSDVFVFSGHGSSLQYILPSDINKIHSKSVLFLFGCDSVAMKVSHGNVEPYASHFDLFKTKCPAIIGAISIIIDNWADISTILILNQCIPISQKWTPKHFGVHYTSIVKALMKKFENIKEPSILSAMSNLRSNDQMSLRMKAALVCRGLPVLNTAI